MAADEPKTGASSEQDSTGGYVGDEQEKIIFVSGDMITNDTEAESVSFSDIQAMVDSLASTSNFKFAPIPFEPVYDPARAQRHGPPAPPAGRIYTNSTPAEHRRKK